MRAVLSFGGSRVAKKVSREAVRLHAEKIAASIGLSTEEVMPRLIEAYEKLGAEVDSPVAENGNGLDFTKKKPGPVVPERQPLEQPLKLF